MNRIALALLFSGCSGTGTDQDTRGGGGSPVSDASVGPDDGSEPSVECGEGEPSAVIGTGDQEFESLSAGDPVTMVHGPQGGWHILGSLRARHIHPVVDISYTIQSPFHSETVSMNNYRVLLTEGDDCTGTFLGMYGYLIGLPGEDFENIYIPDLLGGHTLELRMDIRDLNGVELTSTVEILAELDPIDIEPDTGGR